jgi:hypothetical protein
LHHVTVLQNQVLRRHSCPYLSPVPRGVFPFKCPTASLFAPAVLSLPMLPPQSGMRVCIILGRHHCGPHLHEALPAAKMAGATRHTCCRCRRRRRRRCSCCCAKLFTPCPHSHRSRHGPTAARAGCSRTSTAAAVDRQKDVQGPGAGGQLGRVVSLVDV